MAEKFNARRTYWAYTKVGAVYTLTRHYFHAPDSGTEQTKKSLDTAPEVSAETPVVPEPADELTPCYDATHKRKPAPRPYSRVLYEDPVGDALSARLTNLINTALAANDNRMDELADDVAAVPTAAEVVTELLATEIDVDGTDRTIQEILEYNTLMIEHIESELDDEYAGWDTKPAWPSS